MFTFLNNLPKREYNFLVEIRFYAYGIYVVDNTAPCLCCSSVITNFMRQGNSLKMWELLT